MNKYAVAAGNWTDAIWSTTSGGTPNTTAPTIDDIAIYDSNSPQGVVMTDGLVVGGLINASEDSAGLVATNANGVYTVGSAQNPGVFLWKPANAATNYRGTLNLYCSQVYTNATSSSMTHKLLSTCEIRYVRTHAQYSTHIAEGVVVTYKADTIPIAGFEDWPTYSVLQYQGGQLTIAGTFDISEYNGAQFKHRFSTNQPRMLIEPTGVLLNNSTTKTIFLDSYYWARINGSLIGFSELLIRFKSVGASTSYFEYNCKTSLPVVVQFETAGTFSNFQLYDSEFLDHVAFDFTEATAAITFAPAGSAATIKLHRDFTWTSNEIDQALPAAITWSAEGSASQTFYNGGAGTSFQVKGDKTGGGVWFKGSTFVISDDSTCENIANSGTIEVPESTKLTTRYTAVGAARLEGTGTIRTDRSPTRALA